MACTMVVVIGRWLCMGGGCEVAVHLGHAGHGARGETSGGAHVDLPHGQVGARHGALHAALHAAEGHRAAGLLHLILHLLLLGLHLLLLGLHLLLLLRLDLLLRLLLLLLLLLRLLLHGGFLWLQPGALPAGGRHGQELLLD